MFTQTLSDKYLFVWKVKNKGRPKKRKEKILKIEKIFKKYLSMRVLVKYSKGLGMNLVSFWERL